MADDDPNLTDGGPITYAHYEAACRELQRVSDQMERAPDDPTLIRRAGELSRTMNFIRLVLAVEGAITRFDPPLTHDELDHLMFLLTLQRGRAGKG